MIRIWATQDPALANSHSEARELRDHWVVSLLSRELHLTEDRLVVARREGEKPLLLLDGESGDPRGKGWSVAHSGEWLALAYAEVEVGLDFEGLRQLHSPDRLVERYFSPDERSLYVAADPEQRMRIALEGWTRREALYKALGFGVRGMGERIHLERAQDKSDAFLSVWSGARFRIEPWRECPSGFLGSVAYASEKAIPVKTRIIAASWGAQKESDQTGGGA